MDDALYEEVKAMMLRLDAALPPKIHALLEESAELCQRI